MTRRITYLILLAILLPPQVFASDLADPPKRSSGLWEVTSNSPFAWSICVSADKDRLIDDDLWSNFDNECELKSQQNNGKGYSFSAVCEETTTLTGTIEGDFSSSYKAVAITSFMLNGEKHNQTSTLEGRFIGECPLDLPPGTKKMMNGMTIKGIYEKR
jgi:hypothetical protein